MAGLLDFLNTDQGRMGLGLLAAAGPRTDGAGFGQRLQEGMGSFDAYKQNQLKTKHAEMQMQEYEQGVTQKQQAAAEQARIRGIVSQGGTDWQGMIRAGVPVELVKQLAESQNFGRSKVARTAEVEGPNGQKMVQSFDDYGQQVGQGVNGYVAPQLIDQGDRKTFAKPMLGASFPVGMSPEGRDASARGWAGVNQSAARLEFEKAGGAEGNKPQLVDGQWIYKPDAISPQGRVVPVQGMADKPLNDSQGKANLFGSRMVEAEKAFQSVKDKADRPGWIKRTTQATVGLVPFAGDKLSEVAGSALNFTQSAPQQQVEQAKEDFINALMRRESGAVIGRDEFSNADRQYFPQVGDSVAKIAQKARNRETAIKGIMAEVPKSRSGGVVNFMDLK